MKAFCRPEVGGLYPVGKYKALLEGQGIDTTIEMFGVVLSTSDDPDGHFQLALTLEPATIFNLQ